MEEMNSKETIETTAEFVEEEKVEKKPTVLDKAKGLVKQGLDKAKDGVEYAKNNPDKVVEKGLGAAAVIGTGLLVIAGIKADNKLQRTVYSDDIDECVELKKKLTNKDKTELDYRVKNGQTKIEALQSMGLVK